MYCSIFKHNVGGGFCFNGGSCKLRWKQSPALMSSKNFLSTLPLPSGGLLSLNNSDVYYFPFCSSDSWSGNSSAPTFGFVFRGAEIFREAALSVVDFSRD